MTIDKLPNNSIQITNTLIAGYTDSWPDIADSRPPVGSKQERRVLYGVVFGALNNPAVDTHDPDTVLDDIDRLRLLAGRIHDHEACLASDQFGKIIAWAMHKEDLIDDDEYYEYLDMYGGAFH